MPIVVDQGFAHLASREPEGSQGRQRLLLTLLNQLFGGQSSPSTTTTTKTTSIPGVSESGFGLPQLLSQLGGAAQRDSGSVPSFGPVHPASASQEPLGKTLGSLFSFQPAVRPTFDYAIPTNMEGSYLAPGFAMANQPAGFSYVPSPEGVTPTWNEFLVMNPGGTLDVATMNRANTGWASRTPVGTPASFQIREGLSPEDRALATKLLPMLQSASKPAMEAGMGEQFWGGGPEGGISGTPLPPALSTPTPPFSAGVPTPWGSVGGNLPPGASLPPSQGGIAQLVEGAGGSPALARFVNSILGGPAAVMGAGASTLSGWAGAPGWMQNLVSLLPGALKLPSLGPMGGIGSFLNNLIGSIVTLGKNRETVGALNKLTETGDLSQVNKEALGRLNAPGIVKLGQALANAELTGIPATYALQLEAAYGNKEAETLLNIFHPLMPGLQGMPTAPSGLSWGAGGWTVGGVPVGAGTGNPIPGSTDFGSWGPLPTGLNVGFPEGGDGE